MRFFVEPAHGDCNVLTTFLKSLHQGNTAFDVGFQERAVQLAIRKGGAAHVDEHGYQVEARRCMGRTPLD